VKVALRILLDLSQLFAHYHISLVFGPFEYYWFIVVIFSTGISTTVAAWHQNDIGSAQKDQHNQRLPIAASAPAGSAAPNMPALAAVQ
jgi:hypothetical protein